MRPLNVALAVGAAVLMAAWGIAQLQGAAPTERSVPARRDTALTLSQPFAEPARTDGAVNQRPSARTVAASEPTLRTDLVAALHDDHPYARFTRLWDNWGRGGYAAASLLKLQCRSAWLLARSAADGRLPNASTVSQARAPQALPGQGADLANARQRAFDSIDQRCRSIAEDPLRAAAPADDPYSRDRQQMQSTQDARALLTHYLKYERFDVIMERLGTSPGDQVPWFEGKALGGAGRADLYDQALRVAAVMLYADPQSPSPHLYALALCAQKGLCTGSLEERLLADYPAGSPERATIQALYPRMMAAVLRGDLDAFEFRKKP